MLWKNASLYTHYIILCCTVVFVVVIVINVVVVVRCLTWPKLDCGAEHSVRAALRVLPLANATDLLTPVV